jgi:hypothetical protein
MQLITFLLYMHKLRNCIALPEDLPANSLYMLFVESTQDYMSMHEMTYQTTPMYLPLQVRLTVSSPPQHFCPTQHAHVAKTTMQNQERV